MIASLAHAVMRTSATLDQLGVLWGSDIHPNLSVHGLSHEQIHELGGAEQVWRDYAYPHVERYIASTRLRTPMGWEVVFMGLAAVTSCLRCGELSQAEAIEAAQLAGLDGSGL